MSKYTFIDNIFGTDDEEEEQTAANSAFADDEFEENDDDDDDEEEDDDELPQEDAASLAALDKAFRKVRARIRASTDLSELRSMRAEQSAELAGPLSPTVRLRTQDLIEEIDIRVTDLRASRGPRGT